MQLPAITNLGSLQTVSISEFSQNLTLEPRQVTCFVLCHFGAVNPRFEMGNWWLSTRHSVFDGCQWCESDTERHLVTYVYNKSEVRAPPPPCHVLSKCQPIKPANLQSISILFFFRLCLHKRVHSNLTCLLFCDHCLSSTPF